MSISIHTNKVSPLKKKERASVPEITKRGTITIEASFGIPLFLLAAVCLIWLIEVQSIRVSVVNAAQSAAKNAAEDAAVLPVASPGRLKSDIVSLIGADRINRSIIKGGSSGISCIGSYISGGEMNVKVRCKIQVPVPLLGSPSAELKESFRISSWQGYGGGYGSGDGEESGGDVVYMTENGLVYHTDYQCSYLQLSIRYVPYSSLSDLRNSGGGRYHACEKCVYGTAMGGVYITEDGGKYHNSLSCSGLKRTIHAVHQSEIGGVRPCSRCSQKTGG